jgi:hypothetical protein
MELTEVIYVKHTFTEKESLDLARKMARANSEINEKMGELKSITTSIKADIAEKEGSINSCSEKLNSGYEMRKVECILKYEENKAKYYDRATGELIEERGMTASEQLKLAGKWTDAEKVIRAVSEEIQRVDAGKEGE